MAIRERILGNLAFSDGGLSSMEMPRDAVYHLIQLSVFAATFTSVQGSMGTGPTLESNFPFSLMKRVTLTRNGSDTFFMATGAQLAKEHYYLNKSSPFARLYTLSGQTETLRTATVRGITVPANSDGICANGGGFTVPTGADSTVTMYFDCEVEIWLQMGPSDSWLGTLVDARTLASWVIGIEWATVASIAIPGTANTNTVQANFQVTSIDQDNIQVAEPFGTFKRSTIQYPNIPYGSSNFQIQLPRGNFFQGIQLQTRAQKSASTTVLFPENGVLGQVLNRINTNYQLRQFNFNALQAKNMSDDGGRPQPYSTALGHPQGFAYLYYPSAANQGNELIPTYNMDMFDLQVSTNDIGSARNGTTTSSTNPIIDLLIEEIIPGVPLGNAAPQAAINGSTSVTSAKPYSRSR